MNRILRTEVKRKFKNFVGGNYLPKSVYEKRCNVEAKDCCGGKGNTCAPEDVPETWHDLIDEFAEKHDYDTSEIAPVIDSIFDELEQRLPA